MRERIWWADVLRARHELGARTPAEFAAVAEALGFEVTAAPAAAQPRPAPTRPPVPAPVEREPGRTPRPQWQGEVSDDPARSTQANLPVLQPVALEPFGPAVSAAGEVLARTAPVAVPRRRWPLLAPHSAAAVLQFLLSRQVPGGDPDIEHALDLIGSGLPITELPGRPVRTLRYGTQVLVDHAESMQPFRRDQVDVVDLVTAVVGAGQTEVVNFADLPLRGAGTGRPWTWAGYRPPAPGTCVLLLTDFGIGGDPLSPRRSSTAEWITFLRLLHSRECQPIALVPYPARRWPPRVRRRCPMIAWDRHTTAGMARAVTP